MAESANNGEREKAAEVWMTFWDHPVRFVQECLGAEPEPYQADVLDALAEFPRVAVRSGHGVGKTAVAAWAVTWFLVTRPLSKVPTTAPTFEKQVRDIFWAEIHRWVGPSFLAGGLELSQTRMAVKGFEEEWFAVGMSAARPENLEGFHAPHLLYVIDEAKGVSDAIFDGIQGALTTDAKLFLISTPGARLGYFHQVFTKLRTTWKTFHIPCLGRWEDAKALPSENPISPRISPEWIGARKEEWGESSPVYQARVMGEFPSEGEDALISLSHIEAAEGRQAAAWSEMAESADADSAKGFEHTRWLKRALGVDVARYGSDFTVFTIVDAYSVTGGPGVGGHGPEDGGSRGPEWYGPTALRFVRRREKKSVVDVAAEAEHLAREWKVNIVAVDDTGVGGGVTDLIAEAGLEVLPIHFGGATSDAQSFLNLKAEIFWGLRRAFEAGAISLDPTGGEVSKPDMDSLIGQLSAMKYEIKPRGIRIVDPDEAARKMPGAARGRPARSPDHAHSFALAWWAAGGFSAAESVLLDDSRESERYTRRRFYTS
ncbi:MAG: hypothetical protein ACE5JS_04525 [Nitrospinota bacterium]